jgi:hypothetical protein
MMALSDITELYDDLIDGDKEISHAQIHKAFYTALVTLPTNPFYLEHQGHLSPLIVQAIALWQTSNILQGGSVNDRAVSYTLRNMDLQIVQAVVLLTRGHDVMMAVAPQIWRAFAAEQDDVLEWVMGD